MNVLQEYPALFIIIGLVAVWAYGHYSYNAGIDSVYKKIESALDDCELSSHTNDCYPEAIERLKNYEF